MTMPSTDTAGVAHVTPTGDGDLDRFECLVRERSPFTFVRFSDGEVEILHNRKLIIFDGVTEFRGNLFTNKFPEFDRKCFNPIQHQNVRRDLLGSAIYREEAYFKGILTKNNDAVGDREFLLRLNGGFTPQMTFTDLFLNSNYVRSRTEFFPFIVSQFNDVIVVGNWRCNLNSYLQKGRLVKIPDNFFSCYQETLNSAFSMLEQAPKLALILCSASSLTNVLGHMLRVHRPDLTFLDIGTALNDLMGLPLGTRAYHKLFNPSTLSQKFAAWRYRYHHEYKIRW